MNVPVQDISLTPRKQWTIPAIVAGATLACLSALNSTAGESTSNQSSAIGKPFRVSNSVAQFCAMKPVQMMCEAFEPLLAEFLAESRDAQWAAPVEKLIAKAMLVNGQPRVEIRALECRRMLCALEYAVSIDDLNHNSDGDVELDRLMEPTGGVTAPEPTPGSGNGKIVSVLIWRRRP